MLHYHIDWLLSFTENVQASDLEIHPSLIELVREAAVEVALQDLPDERYYQFDVLADRRGVVGRPRLYIPPEDMEWFVSCSYSAVSMAQSLGVHPNTTTE